MTHLREILARRLDRIGPSGATPLKDWLALQVWAAYGRIRQRRPPTQRSAHAIGAEALTPYADPTFYRRHVLEDLLPFWRRHGKDELHGGFTTYLDRHGRCYAPAAPKHAAMQARMVYAFSVGAELDPDGEWMVEAEGAFRFLMAHLWDEGHGGWIATVEPDGRPRDTRKDLFTQAYNLIGIQEYFRVSGDQAVLDVARRAWALIEERARDGVHQGYFQTCDRDWRPAAEQKTSCVHLDLLAAAQGLYAITRAAADLERVRDLADLLVHRLTDPKHGLVLEIFQRNWVYHPAACRDRVQVGHVLKAVSLLLAAAEATGDAGYTAAADALGRRCLSSGWDPVNAGFYRLVSRTGVLADSDKLWWHQTEGLEALARLAIATEHPAYAGAFLRLAAFLFTRMSDPEFGEWYTLCRSDGAVVDSNKGGFAKAAYHTVATCHEVAALLELRAGFVAA